MVVCRVHRGACRVVCSNEGDKVNTMTQLASPTVTSDDWHHGRSGVGDGLHDGDAEGLRTDDRKVRTR